MEPPSSSRILTNNYLINKSIDNNIKESFYIICPECKENCIIDFKDYKISLNECEKNHKKENISLDKFYNSIIEKPEILCKNCKKDLSNKESFYKCENCNIILCKECSYIHKNHKILDYKYELMISICQIHNESFTFYCKDCHRNLCDSCKSSDNNNHSFIQLKEMEKSIDTSLLFKKIKKLRDLIKIKIEQLEKIDDLN